MLKGIGALGDMAKMMKAAKEAQEQMMRVQEELRTTEITGGAGAGLVKVTVMANGEVKGIDIDPSLFKDEEKEVIEDLIVAGIKDAQAKAQAHSAEKMSAITAGLGLPDGIKLPF